MTLRTYRARLIPLSAFGTKLKGDTFFGQLCWAVRNRFGEARLIELLRGYTDGQPFLVVSDALPAGYLPRPTLPSHHFEEDSRIDRKTAKKRIWLPFDRFQTSVESWVTHCVPSSDLSGGAAEEFSQPHNTLNRHTGTTGEGPFSPYTLTQLWYGKRATEGSRISKMPPSIVLDVYVVLDDSCLSSDELRDLLSDIGATGFGRDASIGLGKFAVEEVAPFDLPAQDNADAWLTLAPCSPQGLPWRAERCFYHPFTRFGRHGDIGVHGQGGPFKTPVLLADTGAMLTPTVYEDAFHTGRGLGGDGSLSKTIPGTVHQGYAPVVAIALPRSIDGP